MEQEEMSERSVNVGMQAGFWAAVMWMVCFLGSVFAREMPLLGGLQLPLVFVSLYYVARRSARFGAQWQRHGVGRAVSACFWSFFFCALATTFFQFVYFVAFDGGRFVALVEDTLRQMTQAGAVIPVQEGFDQVLAAFADPSAAVRFLLLSNMMFALIATPMAALSAIVALSKFRKHNL